MRLIWVSGAAFLLAVASGLVFFMRGAPSALDTGDKIGSIGSLVFGAASLVVAVVTLRQARQAPDDDPAVLLDRAVEELARLVDAQWRREAQWRGLLHPGPMRVTWASTKRPVSAPVSEIAPLPGTRPTRLRLRGEIGEVADTWRQLPAKQLVVIGLPAAGKTSLAVLFVREVLASRKPGEPVPVLLNVAGWDPATTHLDTWLARRLTGDYPQLTTRGFGTDAPVRLVDRQRVIPVLDGLDEMPEAARPLAVTALNQAVAGDRPLVVTCRTEEYEATIAASGAPLGRAAVVELAPLSGDDVAEFLPAGQIDGPKRWSAVLAQLRAEPDGTLAEALSNPLMAFLAKTAYETTDTDPDELLAFGTSTELEEHLFETYLPMAYRPRLPAPSEESLHPYRTEDVHKWLSLIASQLQGKGKDSLCLWRLGDVRPGFRRTAGMLCSWRGLLLAGGLALLGLAAARATFLTILVILFLSPMGGFFIDRRQGTPSPTRVRFRPMRAGAGLLMLIGVPVLFGQLHYLGTGWAGWVGFAALVAGIAVAGRTIVIGLIDKSPSKAVLSPAVALRQDREAVRAVSLGGASLTSLLGIGLILTGTSIRPYVFVLVLLLFMVIGIWLGLATSAMLDVGHVWARWVTGRTWLAFLGLLPWRLLPFIEDAHRRGVLRAVGTEYQFRHARLQDYLSSSCR